MHHHELLEMLGRCRRVIDMEAQTLERWTQQSGLGAAQAAACRVAIERMTVGPSSPAARVDNLLMSARAMAEGRVRRPPTPDHEVHVAETERSAAFRAGLSAPSLPTPTLELAIAIAPDNAEMAAMNAAMVFNHCAAA